MLAFADWVRDQLLLKTCCVGVLSDSILPGVLEALLVSLRLVELLLCVANCVLWRDSYRSLISQIALGFVKSQALLDCTETVVHVLICLVLLHLFSAISIGLLLLLSLQLHRLGLQWLFDKLFDQIGCLV